LEPTVSVMLTLGLLGSTHCLVMCGSIAGALALSLPPACRRRPACLARYLAAYNLGRVATYAAAGGLGGLFGAALAGAGQGSPVQGVLRVFSALVLIAAGLYLTGWVPWLSRIDRMGEPLWRRLEPLGRRLLPIRGLGQAFWFGVVWGWLPCGLVYYALLLALSTASPWAGAFFMLLFGIGTLPAVAGMGVAAGWLVDYARKRKVQQVAGLLLVATGVWGLASRAGVAEGSHLFIH